MTAHQYLLKVLSKRSLIDLARELGHPGSDWADTRTLSAYIVAHWDEATVRVYVNRSIDSLFRRTRDTTSG